MSGIDSVSLDVRDSAIPRKGEGEVDQPGFHGRCSDFDLGRFERFFEGERGALPHISDPRTAPHSRAKVRSATSLDRAPPARRLSKNAFVLGRRKAWNIYNHIDDTMRSSAKLDGNVISYQGNRARPPRGGRPPAKLA